MSTGENQYKSEPYSAPKQLGSDKTFREHAPIPSQHPAGKTVKETAPINSGK